MLNMVFRIEYQQINDPKVTVNAPYQKLIVKLEFKTKAENADEKIGEK